MNALIGKSTKELSEVMEMFLMIWVTGMYMSKCTLSKLIKLYV